MSEMWLDAADAEAMDLFGGESAEDFFEGDAEDFGTEGYDDAEALSVAERRRRARARQARRRLARRRAALARARGRRMATARPRFPATTVAAVRQTRPAVQEPDLGLEEPEEPDLLGEEPDLLGEEPDLLAEGEEYFDDLLREGIELYEDDVDLGEVLRGALLEDYEDALPEEIDEALFNVFDSLTPAESFNLGKALGQIEKGATQVLADPALGQIAGTVLPIAGGAVGTYLGGPAGTAVGASLGSAAVKALPKSGKAGPSTAKLAGSIAAPGRLPSTKPPVAGGSAAAAQGLVLTQQPEVLQSLLALALGEHGRKSINGVPVGAAMNLLSTVFGQAAADADELMYASEQKPAYLRDAEGYADVDSAAPGDRAQALYAALVNTENEQLMEAAGWR